MDGERGRGERTGREDGGWRQLLQSPSRRDDGQRGDLKSNQPELHDQWRGRISRAPEPRDAASASSPTLHHPRWASHGAQSGCGNNGTSRPLPARLPTQRGDVRQQHVRGYTLGCTRRYPYSGEALWQKTRQPVPYCTSRASQRRDGGDMFPRGTTSINSTPQPPGPMGFFPRRRVGRGGSAGPWSCGLSLVPQRHRVVTWRAAGGRYLRGISRRSSWTGSRRGLRCGA